MAAIQKRLDDLARYTGELGQAITPWERSFWEEMIARARADLKRYGYNN